VNKIKQVFSGKVIDVDEETIKIIDLKMFNSIAKQYGVERAINSNVFIYVIPDKDYSIGDEVFGELSHHPKLSLLFGFPKLISLE